MGEGVLKRSGKHVCCLLIAEANNGPGNDSNDSSDMESNRMVSHDLDVRGVLPVSLDCSHGWGCGWPNRHAGFDGLSCRRLVPLHRP